MAFFAAVVGLHFLRPDLNPARHGISEYALARYGWLMRSAFVALGVGVLATAASLGSTFQLSIWLRVGLPLLVATAIGLFLQAGFNTDHLGIPETFDGAIHGDGILIVCLTLPVASYMLGSGLARSTRASTRPRWLQALGPLQLLAILAFQIGPKSYHGLIERIAVTMGIVTLVLLQSSAFSVDALPRTRRRKRNILVDQQPLPRLDERSCG